jgi:hypothetical protein
MAFPHGPLCVPGQAHYHTSCGYTGQVLPVATLHENPVAPNQEPIVVYRLGPAHEDTPSIAAIPHFVEGQPSQPKRTFESTWGIPSHHHERESPSTQEMSLVPYEGRYAGPAVFEVEYYQPPAMPVGTSWPGLTRFTARHPFAQQQQGGLQAWGGTGPVAHRTSLLSECHLPAQERSGLDFISYCPDQLDSGAVSMGYYNSVTPYSMQPSEVDQKPAPRQLLPPPSSESQAKDGSPPLQFDSARGKPQDEATVHPSSRGLARFCHRDLLFASLEAQAASGTGTVAGSAGLERFQPLLVKIQSDAGNDGLGTEDETIVPNEAGLYQCHPSVQELDASDHGSMRRPPQSKGQPFPSQSNRRKRDRSDPKKANHSRLIMRGKPERLAHPPVDCLATSLVEPQCNVCPPEGKASVGNCDLTVSDSQKNRIQRHLVPTDETRYRASSPYHQPNDEAPNYQTDVREPPSDRDGPHDEVGTRHPENSDRSEAPVPVDHPRCDTERGYPEKARIVRIAIARQKEYEKKYPQPEANPPVHNCPTDHEPILDPNFETHVLFFNGSVQVDVSGQPIGQNTRNDGRASSLHQSSPDESSPSTSSSNDSSLDLRGRASLWR